MEQLDNNKLKEYNNRLLLARMRLLNDYSFYGLLLMHTKFGIDPKAKTAYTTGKKICFGPKFLEELDDNELEFILMHEILHIVLKHCYRGTKYNQFVFNIACDIVVNSNILKSKDMDINSITLKNYGPSMHLAPDGKEGFNYTAEEVYEMLHTKAKEEKIDFSSFDDHDFWEMSEDDAKSIDEIIVSATVTLENGGKGTGKIPLGVLREFDKITKPQINWREVLSSFISNEICDYSFTPPDKRFDGPFYMPDFNEMDEVIKLNALFVVDTSGSISKSQLGAALGEIKSAIDINPKMDGYIVCLDANVYEPTDIKDFNIDDFKAVGGGGTNFKEFFDNLDLIEKKIDSIDLIIFITDGYDEFPPQELSRNIPVLWLINNNRITPPWGMVARFDV